MQHVERNKCVFISSRLIYSLLACRRESRTTICIGVWRNDVDVSYHIVFLHYDPFYCYIATVFLFARMCACTLCIKQKATLRGAQRRELNTKMGRKSEIAAERREGRDATGSKCIILSIRPQPMIKMEIFFFLYPFFEENGQAKSLWSCVSVFVIDYESAGFCFKMPVFSGLT